MVISDDGSQVAISDDRSQEASVQISSPVSLTHAAGRDHPPQGEEHSDEGSQVSWDDAQSFAVSGPEVATVELAAAVELTELTANLPDIEQVLQYWPADVGSGGAAAARQPRRAAL